MQEQLRKIQEEEERLKREEEEKIRIAEEAQREREEKVSFWKYLFLCKSSQGYFETLFVLRYLGI